MWEAVLLSITPSFVNRTKKENPAIGSILYDYKKDIDRPLSAILTLNTIAHTVGAIGVGAQATNAFGHTPLNIGSFSIGWETIAAVVMTLAILIISEIIPKTIGANNWKSLTPFTVNSLKILIVILKPLVWLSQLITKSLKKDKNKSVLSRADFTAMAEVVAQTGVLNESEFGVIDNMLRLKDLRVKDIMTPRLVIVSADEDLSIEAFYEKSKPLRFSRIPVFKGREDHLTGLVLKDEILENTIEGFGDKKLSDIKREINIIKDTDRLPKFYEGMMESRIHLNAVVDEYGSLVGIATMEDLVETILGLEIMDEMDKVEDLQLLARQIWEKRAKKLGLLTE